MRALTLNGPMFDAAVLGTIGVADIRLLQWPALPALIPFLLGGLRLAMGAGFGLALGAMTPLPLFWLAVGLLAGTLMQVWARPPVQRVAAPPEGVVRLDR